MTLRPDWVCEIMSDSDARRRDAVQKRRIYADHGIPHYWLLDTQRQILIVPPHRRRLCRSPRQPDPIASAPNPSTPSSFPSAFSSGDDED